jgi:hypothetical protein
MLNLRSELDDLLNVARESNKQLSGYMANPELNFPEIEPDDDFYDWFDSYDALGEEAARDEI